MAEKSTSGRFRKSGRFEGNRIPKSRLPDISIGKEPVGRDTLAVIRREELASPPTSRKPFVTIGYDEMSPAQDRRNVTAEQHTSRDRLDTSPEVSVSEARPGLATMAAIDEELLRVADLVPQSPQPSQYEAAEVLELLTFVILDKSLPVSATEEERREFVAQRLWHRLPAGGLSTVRRIDTRPADDVALLMRVWCAVPKPERS